MSTFCSSKLLLLLYVALPSQFHSLFIFATAFNTESITRSQILRMLTRSRVFRVCDFLLRNWKEHLRQEKNRWNNVTLLLFSAKSVSTSCVQSKVLPTKRANGENWIFTIAFCRCLLISLMPLINIHIIIASTLKWASAKRDCKCCPFRVCLYACCVQISFICKLPRILIEGISSRHQRKLDIFNLFLFHVITHRSRIVHACHRHIPWFNIGLQSLHPATFVRS